MSTPKFRLNCKKIFMTYAQCPGTKDELLLFLNEKLNIEKHIIALELHKDGGTHFHVFLVAVTKFDIKNPTWLDWNGYHPQMEKVKNESRCKKYCTKDGDYITNMKFDTYQVARDIAKGGDYIQALRLIMEELPKEIKFLDKWEKNLKRVAELSAVSAVSDLYKVGFKFKELKGIEEWNRSQRTLVLFGPSGWGKTQYAKQLFKNPLLCRHRDKLKKFDKFTHDGIIFDDMHFSHWDRTYCIHLLDLDEDSDIDVKCSMVTIPAGTPRVITTNLKPCEIFSAFDKAIRRRIHSIEFKEDLRMGMGKAAMLFSVPSTDGLSESKEGEVEWDDSFL